MENKKISRAELEALNLSEEEIKAILNSEESGSGSGLPYPLAKVNFDSDAGKTGIIGIAPIKDEDGYTTGYEHTLDGDITFRVLNSYFQYSFFNPATNKPEIVSNMFKLKDAKKARDIKTGQLISELKKTNDKIKFSEVALCEFNLPDGGSVVAIMYIKGKYLFDLNEQLKKLKKNKTNRTWITLRNKKVKNGSISFFVPEIIDVQEESMTDFLKEVKVVAGYITPFDNWAAAIGNNDSSEKLTENTNTSEDTDEDDIAW